MVCVSPPEPDDSRLLAYLDGEADLDLQAHIERCPHCRSRAQQLAAFEGRLAARLYRVLCPTPHELGEYHLDLLPVDRAAAVAEHLTGCPHCTREMAQLRVFMADRAPAHELGPRERVRERVRLLIAQLVPSGPGAAPSLAGIRGQDQGSLVYQADGIEVVLGVQPDADRPDQSAILGLVLGLQVSGVTATLWRGNQQIAAVPVDELDSFVIPSVAPGSYELVLSGPDLDLVIRDLEIGTRSAKRNADPQE